MELSFILVKKTWLRSLVLGLGFGTGLGIGIGNCKFDFEHPLLLHGRRLVRGRGQIPTTIETNTSTKSVEV